MASVEEVSQPHELASRVLRRAQISKMTRALQDRLALANIKIKKGWQNRSIDSIEPEIEKELKRKRADSNLDRYSETSSNASNNCFSSELPMSSPLTAPMFSDDLPRSGDSLRHLKRTKTLDTMKHPAIEFHTRAKSSRAEPAKASWKTVYHLPESSPILKSKAFQKRPSVAELQTFSFASETSTVLDSASASEDDDQDLPLHSFQISPEIPSSPPRTPPPDVARSARLRNKMFSSPAQSNSYAGREGADLLLYLASSPSPAMRVDKGAAQAPSTPPAKNTPLPSSMMSTPGGQTYVSFGPTTPSGGFNFADYVNVTPSPAQGHWTRTPAAAKTPLAREARSRHNYDALMPPPPAGVSPNLTRSAARRDAGLGMDLGGEISR